MRQNTRSLHCASVGMTSLKSTQVSVQGPDANLGHKARKIGRLAELNCELCLVNVLVDVLASTRDNAITGFLVQFETHLGEILVSLGQDAVVVAVFVNLVAEGQPGTEVHRLITGSTVPGIDQRIAERLGGLMPHNVDAAIGIDVFVRAGLASVKELVGAAVGAASRITDERILDGLPAHDRVRGSMVSAVLGAHATVVDVLVGEADVDSVGVVGKVFALDRRGDNRLNIAEGLSL